MKCSVPILYLTHDRHNENAKSKKSKAQYSMNRFYDWLNDKRIGWLTDYMTGGEDETQSEKEWFRCHFLFLFLFLLFSQPLNPLNTHTQSNTHTYKHTLSHTQSQTRTLSYSHSHTQSHRQFHIPHPFSPFLFSPLLFCLANRWGVISPSAGRYRNSWLHGQSTRSRENIGKYHVRVCVCEREYQ